MAGNHDVVLILRRDVAGLDDAGDLLLLLQRQDVDHIGSARAAGAFRNLISLDAVNLALVGEEHQVIVGGAGVDLADKVLVPAAHAADAASAAALGLVDIQRLALEVAKVGQGDHALLLRNQVLDVDLALHRGKLGAARVVELLLDLQQLLLDDGADLLLVGQDGVVLGDLGVQLIHLGLDLLALQPCQTAQRHLHNGLRLHVVQTKPLHQGSLAFLHGVVGADNRDNLVDVVQRSHQALQNVGALLGLFQVKDGPAGDDLFLELDVFVQHLVQGERLWLAAHQRQHDDADGVLQLGVGEQLI